MSYSHFVRARFGAAIALAVFAGLLTACGNGGGRNNEFAAPACPTAGNIYGGAQRRQSNDHNYRNANNDRFTADVQRFQVQDISRAFRNRAATDGDGVPAATDEPRRSASGGRAKP